MKQKINILYGPPESGKTAFVNLFAKNRKAAFIYGKDFVKNYLFSEFEPDIEVLLIDHVPVVKMKHVLDLFMGEYIQVKNQYMNPFSMFIPETVWIVTQSEKFEIPARESYKRRFNAVHIKDAKFKSVIESTVFSDAKEKSLASKQLRKLLAAWNRMDPVEQERERLVTESALDIINAIQHSGGFLTISHFQTTFTAPSPDDDLPF